MAPTQLVTPPIQQIGRQALSIVLSFLSENDGCCLLLTRRIWACQLLPVFRLPQAAPTLQELVVDDNYANCVDGGLRKKRGPLNRHRFKVIDVVDSKILLLRLNTRRLYRRRRYLWRLSLGNGENRPVSAKQIDSNVPSPYDDWEKAQRRCLPHSETLPISSHVAFPPLLRFVSRNVDPFLPGTTVLASYPRSGNTLLRTYLEHCTGVVTGSDTRPNRTLSLALTAHHDLVGEGVCARSQVGICKTHWPEREGYLPFPARCAIVIVRNPYDAIDSYWHLAATNTHTQKVTDAVYDAHKEYYVSLVRNEMGVWCQFHDFWLERSREIPVLWVRYEDLVRDPKLHLRRILAFTAQKQLPNGASCDWDVHIELAIEVIRNKLHQNNGYALNGVQSNKNVTFGKALQRFPLSLIDEWHDVDSASDATPNKAPSILSRFGYNVCDQSFPQHIGSFDAPPILPLASPPASVTINERGVNLRPPNCPFGRNTRQWRRLYTADDTMPFPIIRKR